MTLILEDVTRLWHDGSRGVEDISFSLGSGDLLVLCGPSGSGKTTLLRLLAGLESLTSGRIFRENHRLDQQPPHLRDVAMQFQRPALYPHLNVRDNLLFSARLRGQNVEQKVVQIAELLHLEPLMHRLPSQLSGGQHQRVALGRALLTDASLILLDEPFAHLEKSLHQEIRRDLHLLQSRFPTTMIIVTHDPWDAFALGARLAVLIGGRLHQLSSAEQVRDAPATRQVAELIHGPELTLLSGTCELHSLPRLRIDDRSIPIPSRLTPSLVDGQLLSLALPAGAVSTSNGSEVLVGMVRLVEPLRPDLCRIEMQLQSEHCSLIVETERPPKRDEMFSARLDLERAFWFEGVTGAALPLSG